jgi:hypothetical protein
MSITPVPDNCLLTPPVIYQKIVGIKPVADILFRKYATKTNFQSSQIFFTQSKKYV